MDAKNQTPAEAMAPHEQPAPHPPIPPGTIAYEKTDTDPGSIVRVAAVLIAISVLATVIAFFLFRALGTREARQDPAPAHLARPDDGGLPPEPRLQTAPADELLAVRTEEHRSLSGYGWVDEAGGVARIPIEEAMALYVARARGSANAPAPAPSALPPAAASPLPPVHR